MTKDIVRILDYLRSEGFEIMNWMPGNRRIFKILNNKNSMESKGMYSDELRAWYRGYLQGLKGDVKC